MKFFKYDNANAQIVINEPEILLIHEFATLMDDKRNKTKKDPSGKSKTLAFKEFAYIYLFID